MTQSSLQKTVCPIPNNPKLCVNFTARRALNNSYHFTGAWHPFSQHFAQREKNTMLFMHGTWLFRISILRICTCNLHFRAARLLPRYSSQVDRFSLPAQNNTESIQLSVASNWGSSVYVGAKAFVDERWGNTIAAVSQATTHTDTHTRTLTQTHHTHKNTT